MSTVPEVRSQAKPIWFTARDGLRLHALYNASGQAESLPLLCLAGLTRNSRDFEMLAAALSADRDVWRLDYRGRGRSDRDPDWRNYTPFIELIDTLDFMTAMGIDRVALVATSRGGIIGMLMGAIRPGALAAIVLNDIGPLLEIEGLQRIAGYVGRSRLPASWDEAADAIKAVNGRFFPKLADEEWSALARQWFDDEDGRPKQAYDPALARSFGQYGPGSPPPSMWPQFSSLAGIPMLAVRGANSDLLSAETFAEMKARCPQMDVITVADQGHAPLLRDEETIGAIRAFLNAADRREPGESPKPESAQRAKGAPRSTRPRSKRKKRR